MQLWKLTVISDPVSGAGSNMAFDSTPKNSGDGSPPRGKGGMGLIVEKIDDEFYPTILFFDKAGNHFKFICEAPGIDERSAWEVCNNTCSILSLLGLRQPDIDNRKGIERG